MGYRVLIIVFLSVILVFAGKSEAGFMKKDTWEEQHIKLDCKYKLIADKLISILPIGDAHIMSYKKLCNEAEQTIKDFYFYLPYSLSREEVGKFDNKMLKRQYVINAGQLCHSIMDLAYTLSLPPNMVKEKYGIEDPSTFFGKAIFVLYLNNDLNLKETMRFLGLFASKGGIKYPMYYPWALNLAIFFFQVENHHPAAIDMAMSFLMRDLDKVKKIVKEVEKTNLYREACIDLY